MDSNADAGLEILLPYQKDWILDESPLKLAEKSRRVGLSWTEALNAVLEASKASGMSSYYMSYNKDMTRQFIADAAFWAKWLNIAAGELEEEIVRNEDEDFTVFRLRFASGCVVEALPSKAYAVRSKQGRIILDEAAFTDEFEEVLKASLAMLIWGGTLTVLSTHNGEENPFNTLVKNVRRGEEKDWSLHRISFSDAVDAGLYRRICQVKEREWSPEAEAAWVADIRSAFRDNAEEELDVIPRRGGTRYFPRAMLDTCAAADIDIVRLNCRDEFMWEAPEKREREIRRWFLAEVAPTLRSLEGPAYFGQDFARSGDLSVLWVAEEASRTSLDTRLIIELRNVPYDQQWQIVQLLVLTVKRFGGAAFDARGNGQALAEVAAQEYPGYVSMVMLTRPWYAEWFPKLKGRIESQDWLLPEDEHVLGDFGAVTIKNGVPLVAERTADRSGRGGSGGQRHGDGAVAAVLTLFAWHECAGDPAPVAAGSGLRRDRIFAGY